MPSKMSDDTSTLQDCRALISISDSGKVMDLASFTACADNVSVQLSFTVKKRKACIR